MSAWSGQWPRSEEIWVLLVDLLPIDAAMWGKPQSVPSVATDAKRTARDSCPLRGDLQALLLVPGAVPAALGFCRAAG